MINPIFLMSYHIIINKKKLQGHLPKPTPNSKVSHMKKPSKRSSEKQIKDEDIFDVLDLGGNEEKKTNQEQQIIQRPNHSEEMI